MVSFLDSNHGFKILRQVQNGGKKLLAMRLSLLTLLVVLSACVSIAARPASLEPCPEVVITGETEPDARTHTLTLTANLTGATPGKSVYFQWNSNGGNITRGDGTPTIVMVERQSWAPAVYVEVFGEAIPKGCTVRDYRLIGRKGFSLSSPYTDRYYDLPDHQELLHLNNFANELKRDAELDANVWVGRTPEDDPEESAQKLQRIKWYLIDQCGIAPERIVTTDGGTNQYREVRLIAWPKGSGPPKLDDDWWP